MVQKDLILDFNLYLCEKFGYRESCSVMPHANGFCVDIRERDLDCYIRFWEYSCGRGNFPDWSIIIVRSNFKKNQEESLKDLARFFKEYMPRYVNFFHFNQFNCFFTSQVFNCHFNDCHVSLLSFS